VIQLVLVLTGGTSSDSVVPHTETSVNYMTIFGYLDIPIQHHFVRQVFSLAHVGASTRCQLMSSKDDLLAHSE
jgi:hypothetical protein